QLTNYLNDLIGLGVAGFRIDAAKHMAAADIAGILAGLQQPAEVYQEVIEGGGEGVSAQAYFSNGQVTEFDFGLKLAEMFRSGRLADLRTFGESWQELMPSDRAIVFVDNHDNQRGHGGGGGVLTHEDGALYDLANVFMLAWPYGYPRVMSSYAFTHTDQGPPQDQDGTTSRVHQGTAGCSEGWVCEH
ncbi:MAG: ATPase, partial [Anaerolineae bacterium]|nr:ATPase [Anaerolineae bacterium]